MEEEETTTIFGRAAITLLQPLLHRAAIKALCFILLSLLQSAVFILLRLFVFDATMHLLMSKDKFTGHEPHVSSPS